MTSKGRQHRRIRNVTASDRTEPQPSGADWAHVSGRGDPDQQYRIYRLCPCSLCEATGRVDDDKCPDCRGEGRGRELVATCPDPASVGLTIVTLGQEGQFEDCPIGLLHLDGERGKRWLVRPWLASPRNASDAGRVLRQARKERQ